MPKAIIEKNDKIVLKLCISKLILIKVWKQKIKYKNLQLLTETLANDLSIYRAVKNQQRQCQC